jgi:formylglycine-generating enzyme required for sulfatase activity
LGNRNWYIIENGLTFAVIQPGVYPMGQADWLPFEGRSKLVRHDRAVSRRFAISTTEITGLQFSQLNDLPPDQLDIAKDKPQHPLVSISQNDIMKFCLLLTRHEQMDATCDCYEPTADESKGLMVPKATCLDCQGYRMPTEGEIEFAFRAGTKTLTHFGYAPELLSLYEWHGDASSGVHPVARLRPNCWGLCGRNVPGLG